MIASSSPQRTWLDACAEFHAQSSSGYAVLPTLRAFTSPFPRGGPPADPEETWSGDFLALEAKVLRRLDTDRLADVLATEVDRGQAEMFCRRLQAVDQVLVDIGTIDARILRVGLHKRGADILRVGTSRASRIRALADFYYSQAGRLIHLEKSRHAPPLREVVDRSVFQSVAPGISHTTVDGMSRVGPVHVNVLRVDPSQVSIEVVDRREAVQHGIAFEDDVGPICDAAISGGFFLYSETDIVLPSARYDPVGLLVRNGLVVNAATFARAALLVDDAGQVAVRRTSLHAHRLEVRSQTIEFHEAVNRATATVGPDTWSLAIVGQRVIAVGRRLAVPLNGVVVTVSSDCGVEVGDEARFSAPRLGSRSVAQAIAGGPILVEDGRATLDLRREEFWGTAPPVTFSQDETGDANLLARLAVGVRPDGTLIAAAVDGRNLKRALGLTLGDVGELMLGFGCRDAANMDGGSSKRMLVSGRTVDLPSTEIIADSGGETRIRPVHTAVLFRSHDR